jgi:hypothetical protein
VNGYPLAEEVNPARLAREKVGSHVGWHRFVLLQDLRLQDAELQLNKPGKRVAQKIIIVARAWDRDAEAPRAVRPGSSNCQRQSYGSRVK